MSSTKTRIVKVCPHCGRSYDYSEVHSCLTTPTDGLAAVRAKEVADPLIGATLGDRYEITERLSQGGMGVVYKARHKVLGRVVAVKIMLKQQDEATQERFLQEAKIASTLTHPNIVYISDFGVLDDGRSYIVMEYLQGVTLSTVLRPGPLSSLRSCRIAAQIADGLQAVHDKGIIHRDLKPDNIFLLSEVSQGGREDFVKIVDFGISLNANQRATPEASDGGEHQQLTGEAAEVALQRRYTVPGMVMGTPAYMSPEQAQGETLDGRSDQYALGCVLYEMLTGVVPFMHRRNVAKVLMGHISGRVVPLGERLPEAKIPPSLDRLVLQLLAKRPVERFRTMTDISQALEQELKGLNPAANDRSDPAGPVSSHRAGSLRPWLRRILWLVPLGLVLLAGGAYLGYRSLLHPVDQAQMARELLELRQRALAVLQAQLKLPDRELRLRAITSLGQTHEISVRLILEPLLQDRDAQVQSRAAEALGQLGDRRALPALRVVAERTGTPVVRVAAAGALDLLGDALSQKLLHNELTSPDPEARLRAALVLCSASEVEAQKVLNDWLGRGSPPDQVLINTLYRLASAGDVKARGLLLSRLERGGRPEVRLSAAASLAKLGEERGRAELYEAAHRQDQEQLLAARLLASVEGAADLELFRRILANPAASLAALVAAAEGLGDAGQCDDAHSLAGFLTHADPHLRQTAASAIVELTGRDPAALSDQSLAWAEGALTDGNLMIRSSAVATLGDAAGQAVPLLKRVLTSNAEPALRRIAARALARRHERDALGALRLGLTDTDSDVRKETMRGIGKMGQRLRQLGDSKMLKEVKSWLVPLLASSSPQEQMLASGTLYQLGDDSQRARLNTWLGSTDPALRRAALDQVARDPELLAGVLADGSLAVQLAAARKLAELGDPRGTAVLKNAVARGGLDGLSAYALLRKLGVTLSPNPDSSALRFNGDVKVRRAALEALADLPLGEQLPVLLAAAHDSSPELRLRSAELAADLPLGANKLPAGLPLLRRLNYDSNQAVRMRAGSLLSRLLRSVIERDNTASAAAARAARPTPAAPRVSTPGSAGGPSPAARSDGGIPCDGGAPGDAADSGAPAGSPDAGSPDAGSSDAGPSADGGAGRADPVDATAALFDATHLPEVIVTQYLDTSIGALQHKDFKKAQKLLEKASSLCAKKGKRWKLCTQLAPEIAFQLGMDYEAQEQWANAAAEYQKLLPPLAKGKHPRQKVAQAALNRMSARLGRIEISKPVASRCVQGTLWMEPGLHRVSLGAGQSKMIQVQPNQTVELKLCSPREHGSHPP